LENVSEVAVWPDRLEIAANDSTTVLPYEDFAEWPRPVAIRRLLARLGLWPRGLYIADRDWFQSPPNRFFRFYTTPPLIIFMPTDEAKDYAPSYFARVQDVIESNGRFTTADLG
jgi:hypothetical protein